MNKPDTAAAYFKKGFSCSQAVLAAFAVDAGLDEKTALKLSSGFGGGCGHQGLTCGAVTGAYMAIGLKHGRTKAEDLAAKEKTYALVQDFTRQFIKRNKSINCTELLGCDLGTPEGRERMKRENLGTTVCTKFVRDAAEIVGPLL